jgi:hypothetical protein
VVRPYLITPEWIAEKRIKWGEDSPMWYSRVLGDFPEQGEDTLIPLALIEQAHFRYLSTPIDTSAPIRLGVDVARFGSDSSIITASQGLHATKRKTSKKLDLMTLCGEVIDTYTTDHATQINVDVCGLGAGVVDRLIELGYPVTGVNVGSAATESSHYLNLRAEAFWNLRDEFRDGAIAIDPADEDLAAELSSIKYGFDSKGRTKIESKEDMKKRSGGVSPDNADALMLSRIVVPDTDYSLYWTR